MSPTKKTVLAFGAFDGLHDGHRFFLKEARGLGNKLIVSVATDEVVLALKGHAPKQHLEARLQTLEASGLTDLAVAGDKAIGNWNAIKIWKPDSIAVGYDQTHFAEKLREFIQKENLPIEVVVITAHQPERLHSSLLGEK
ncbi:MAG: adenylyltransferase/cytidyltransferase family protein [bacterium]|nr:adenylyltransferase/cytidyltransferase family protein [bacterium]